MRQLGVNMFLTLLWQHMHLLPNSHAPGVVYIKLILNIYCTQVCPKHKQCQVSFLIWQEIRTYFVEKALWLAKCNNFFVANCRWWLLNNTDPGKFNQFYAGHSWTWKMCWKNISYAHKISQAEIFFIDHCITQELPRTRPPPELPPRSPTSTDSTPSLPPNQPDLLRQISAQGSPQSSSEGKISAMWHAVPSTNSFQDLFWIHMDGLCKYPWM